MSQDYDTEKSGSNLGELVIARSFDAPRQQVWEAWTRPERVRQWWGPTGFSCPVAEIDLEPAGRYLFAMRSPEGKDYWSTGIYREIVPPERLVASDSFADERGNVVPASYYGLSGEYPMTLMLMVTFSEENGRTTMTLTHSGHPPGEQMEQARQGWEQSLDQLAASLEQWQAEAA